MKTLLKRFVLTLAGFVFFAPIFLTLIFSFMGKSELAQMFQTGGKGIHFLPWKVTLNGYYELLFSGGEYLGMFWNSILLATAIAVGNTLVGLVVGYVLAKCKFRGRSMLRFIYIVVMMMPFQVTLLPNYIILRQTGLFNTVWALILPGIFSPFGVFLLSQFIRGMSDEMIDAISLETNSPVKLLVHMVVPMVYPGLLALFLLSFADAWNMVEQPLILLQDRWRYPLSLALNSINSSHLSIAFAGAILYILPIVFLYRLFDEELITGLSTVKF